MNRYLFDQINGLAGRSAFADHLMIDAAKYLIALVFLAAAVLVLLALRRRRLVEVAYFGAALALSYGIAVLFQHLVFERRPFENPSLVVHQLVAHAGARRSPVTMRSRRSLSEPPPGRSFTERGDRAVRMRVRHRVRTGVRRDPLPRGHRRVARHRRGGGGGADGGTPLGGRPLARSGTRSSQGAHPLTVSRG